jgi:hypothetical protein
VIEEGILQVLRFFLCHILFSIFGGQRLFTLS